MGLGDYLPSLSWRWRENKAPVEDGVEAIAPLLVPPVKSSWWRQVVIHNDEKNYPKEGGEKFASNREVTTKYTALTFIPKNLFEQFRRLANVYFLVIVCLQLFPGVTNLPVFVSLAPLVMVLAASALKELYEDVKRAQVDKRTNSLKVQVVPQGSDVSSTLKEIAYSDLKVGHVVKLGEGEEIPADIVLLSTARDDGVAFVETSNLDGETNLKPKIVRAQTQGLNSPEAFKPVAMHGAYVRSEKPNSFLYSYRGELLLSPRSEPLELSESQLLLKGTRLANVAWVYGVVVATGEDTKIVQNRRDTPSKVSHVETRLNSLIFALLVVLGLLCLTASLLNVSWTNKNQSGAWYLGLASFSNVDKVVRFARHFAGHVILMNVLVPISLYVSLELVRLYGSYVINHDVALYDSKSNTPARARTSGLIEELGQIEYVFADKTGTMTRNEMTFRKASIRGQMYVSRADRLEASFGERFFEEDIRRVEGVQEFFLAAAMCNTVFPEQDPTAPSGVLYQATSPDEEALVRGAASIGVTLLERSGDFVTLEVMGRKASWEVLGMVEFTSERKRMSVIVRSRDSGKIRVYVKGAETAVFPLLDKRLASKVQESVEHLEDFANSGLRTLVMAYKDMTSSQWKEWKQKRDAANSQNDREKALEAVAADLEQDLVMIGVSGVEDALAEGVPETVAALLDANIKVWMLTGDKQETAVNIGHSAAMIRPGMTQITINATTGKDVSAQLSDAIHLYCHRLSRTVNVLVIDGPSLYHALDTSRDKLLLLAQHCSAVICCRVSPLQKSLVVNMVAERAYPPPITLAVGDGANDVSMIQAAHVGVGIAGREGRQAVAASDFSIGQFAFLKKLLLVHGRWSHTRVATAILYSIYKSALLALPQFWFGPYTGWSAQSLWDNWFIVAFNMFYTSWPVLGYAMLERDVSAGWAMRVPKLYNFTQQNFDYSGSSVAMWTVTALWHSLVVVYGTIAVFGSEVLPDGRTLGSAPIALVAQTVAILIVTAKILLISRTLTAWNHFFIWGSLAFYFVSMPYLSGLEGDFYLSLEPMLRAPQTWAALLLIPWIAMAPDVVVRYWSDMYVVVDRQIVMEIQRWGTQADKEGLLKHAPKMNGLPAASHPGTSGLASKRRKAKTSRRSAPNPKTEGAAAKIMNKFRRSTRRKPNGGKRSGTKSALPRTGPAPKRSVSARARPRNGMPKMLNPKKS